MQQKIDPIVSWIQTQLIPRKTVNKDITSYGLKHICEEDLGFYVSNDQLKEAMIKAGYRPYPDEFTRNPLYRISQKSPALKDRRKRLLR